MSIGIGFFFILNFSSCFSQGSPGHLSASPVLGIQELIFVLFRLWSSCAYEFFLMLLVKTEVL